MLTQISRKLTTKIAPLLTNRLFSSSTTRHKAAAFSHLDHRAVIQLSGAETFDFLQGLVTNDLYDLTDDVTSMYAMMLNTQGRVEYDLIINRIADDALLLDCNRATLEQLTKTIKRYKLRKKVKIELRDDLEVWQGMQGDGLQEAVDNLTTNHEGLISFKDPRTEVMGYRLLTCSDGISKSVNKTPIDVYHESRYKLGVPEGPGDLIPGKALPLESNLDLMNGVSFSKGCYIGQELTARTHHTGVVRKRLVPLQVLDDGNVAAGERIYSASSAKKSAGKVMSICGDVGLGLVRLNHLSEEALVTKTGTKLRCSQPAWWPSLEEI